MSSLSALKLVLLPPLKLATLSVLKLPPLKLATLSETLPALTLAVPSALKLAQLPPLMFGD